MAFTAKDVQALREKTGVGMMDCKKALVETDGDIEKAIDTLRNIVYNTDADAKRIKKRMSASVLFFCALGCGKYFLHFLFLTTISCV